jgi:hypothetical protein
MFSLKAMKNPKDIGLNISVMSKCREFFVQLACKDKSKVKIENIMKAKILI